MKKLLKFLSVLPMLALGANAVSAGSLSIDDAHYAINQFGYSCTRVTNMDLLGKSENTVAVIAECDGGDEYTVEADFTQRTFDVTQNYRKQLGN